jgi:hypothetical protein
MIWYALAMSLTTRAWSGKDGLRVTYRAPRRAASMRRRFSSALIGLVLAAFFIFGAGFIGVAARNSATRLSTLPSSRSPMCVMAQMSARRDWVQRTGDYCAM